MKLLEIIQDIQLNEQLSRFLTKTLPSLGHTFEHNFFTELRRIIGKDLTTISPKEMSAAFKLPQMAGYRKQIADKLMETEFDVVDNILNKYNLSIPQQSINAGKELASTLDIDPAFLKDVKQSYLAKKGAGGTSQSAAAQTAGGAAQPVVNAGGVISRNLDSNELIDFIVTNSQNFPILIGKDGKPIKQVMDQMPSYVKQFADRPIDEVRNEVIPLLDDLAKRITENKTIASEKKMAILKTIGSLKLGVRSTVRGIGVVLFSAILGDFIYKTYLGTKSTGNIAAGALSGALETGKDVYTGGKNFYNKATEQPQQQQQQQQPAQQKPATPGAPPTKTKKEEVVPQAANAAKTQTQPQTQPTNQTSTDYLRQKYAAPYRECSGEYEYGCFNQAAIGKLQKCLGLYVTGYYGKTLQKKLKELGYEKFTDKDIDTICSKASSQPISEGLKLIPLAPK